jgi:ribosomal silencing factor RsfS
MLTKNVEKNVRNISKNVDEKILTTGHKIINKKLKKKSKRVDFEGHECVKWAVLSFVSFIVRLLIHLPVSR